MQADYLERVYAGVLGKIIGVYLGRPVEGWSYDRIVSELGEVRYYVHDRLGRRLIEPDDDISGTFTFLRALEDSGYPAEIAPREIGRAWLNYLIEGRTVLWWGGLATSTEHTAYLRLARGIEAPESGSAALNGRVVSEQIGAQIFIDGWAMVAPGDPVRAARLAEAAARVSHDGEAVWGAQVIAAMESLAFRERSVDALLDAALRLIPPGSTIARMGAEIREWHRRIPDWREARALLDERWGYRSYGGGCHMVPNHGLILLALLYGEDDFQKSLTIVNTGGWDTDCNSGNLGCLLGIKNGLDGIEAGPDWRGPVADRLYLPTADGGRSITDAATEAVRVASAGRRLAGLPPLAPKGGARFHFELPGSVQGFAVESSARGSARLENVLGHSASGSRALAVHYAHVSPGRPLRVGTPTFLPEEHAGPPSGSGYGLAASPTLYPGQTVRARVESDAASRGEVSCSLYVGFYAPADAARDRIVFSRSPGSPLAAGRALELAWTVPDLGGQPVAVVGVELSSERDRAGRADGTVYLDSLSWDGEPRVTLGRPAEGGLMWWRAWVNGVDRFGPTSEPYRLIQDRGRGLAIQGTREWRDYRAECEVTVHMAEAAGLAVRVQGMRRYYALLARRDGALELVRVVHDETRLARRAAGLGFGEPHRLALEARGARIRAFCDGELLCDVEDRGTPLVGGAVALVCEEGRMAAGAVTVGPVA